MGTASLPKIAKLANFGGKPVYVIDDDADLRRSLHFLLETRHATVTSFRRATDFLEAIDSLAPAPLIVDVRMPRMDGLQLIAELKRRQVDWPVIFLSGHGDVTIAVRALKLGATDFLEKPVVAAELEACLEGAFKMLSGQLLSSDTKVQAARRWGLLTRRELGVLELLCEGSSNKQVAFKLQISPRTVEMHRASALRQLQVKSLPEVMMLRRLADVPN